MQLAHGEGRGFRAIPGTYLVVDIGDVALHGAVAKHQGLGYFTIGLPLGEDLQYLPLTFRQVRGILDYPGRLVAQVNLPGGHFFH